MRPFLSSFLISGSICLLLSGCRSVYKNLQPAQGDFKALEQLRPDLSSVLYKTDVTVMGHYLSGLLIIKQMPDSSTRMVFSNEMGIKFFDFSYEENGDFKVWHIMRQMDKKPVITTLKKDLGILLMKDIYKKENRVLSDGNQLYYKIPQPGSGSNYIITNRLTNELVRMERASKRKPVAQVIMTGLKDGVPDSIGISHNGFEFKIGLKKIER